MEKTYSKRGEKKNGGPAHTAVHTERERESTLIEQNLNGFVKQMKDKEILLVLIQLLHKFRIQKNLFFLKCASGSFPNTFTHSLPRFP